MYTDGVEAEPLLPSPKCSTGSRRMRFSLTPVFVVCSIAVTWVGATQFSQHAEVSKHSTNATVPPGFSLWFGTSWLTICWPLTFLVMLPGRRGRRSTHVGKAYAEQEELPLTFLPLSESTASSLSIRGHWRALLKFYALWCIANYAYLRALLYATATVVTSAFSSAPAFVYIFSFLLLDASFSVIECIGVFCSVCGVVVMMVGEGFSRVSWVGPLLGLVAAISAALYKVEFKRVFGDIGLLDTCKVMGAIGVLNFLLTGVIVAILHATSVEQLDFAGFPWGFLVGSAILGVSFNLSVNYGIARTYPLFVSVGTILGIPLNWMIDALVNGKSVNLVQGLGVASIMMGFMCIMWKAHKVLSADRPVEVTAECTSEAESGCKPTAGEEFTVVSDSIESELG